MKLNGASNDGLSAGGTLTYGGTLTLTNISAPLAAGNSFTLFSAAGYSGSFATISPATPGAGLAWNTNNSDRQRNHQRGINSGPRCHTSPASA